MILMFIAGWIAGVIGTLWFGKWYTDREAMKMLEEIIEEKRNEDRTKSSL